LSSEYFIKEITSANGPVSTIWLDLARHFDFPAYVTLNRGDLSDKSIAQRV
jgi:hypothetical protein